MITCTDGCRRTVPDDEAAMRAIPPWESLSITGRWRCPDCRRALLAAAGICGTREQGFVDTLPADSIGALRHRAGGTVTADTIVAPSVRP